jgi:hypothetical protein
MRESLMRKTKEYGDFQTPEALAGNVCALLRQHELRPAALLEPTCGLGRFLFAALDWFPEVQKALGADINARYIEQAGATLQRRQDAEKVQLAEADFFVTDWMKVISELPEPVLLLGNLPWVTNAQLSVLGSQNLPTKSNFQNRNGLDAITGKANFDISEWMLMRLLEAMHGRRGTLAMLCKSSVARKTLLYGWKNRIALERSAIYRIEADLHFDAAVDAALLVTHFRPMARDLEAKVYSRLIGDSKIEAIIGYEDGMLLADVAAYHRSKHLCGEEVIKWRSGIKHDCSKIMEVCQEGDRYRNGLGELVDLEDTYLFPMLKSSQVARDSGSENRYMLVTQRTMGGDTKEIEELAPRTWAYLKAHADLLNRRRSSIYRNRPPFSIFGVGEYSFAPWKVAVSGFYKKLAFVTVGPIKGKPVMLDDTSYFLPCQTQGQAEYLGALLNSSTAQAFYEAFVFWDSKRPITADLLRRLDLRRLARQAGSEEKFNMYFGKPECLLFV